MRLLVIGEKLESILYEIVKISQILGCCTKFFKKNICTQVDDDDVLIIDSDKISILPENIKNTIISISYSPNYVPSRHSEEVVCVFSVPKILDIIKQRLERKNKLPIIADPISRNIFNIAEKIAISDANVLITGETGTGKEVLAKYIHGCSNRSNNSFVAVNCAAIPDTLLESEMFGHEKGAFTNALQRRVGKFEEAHLGTLLLDEISEMSPSLQAKLLRVIQEKEFSRLGGNGTVKTDVRVIATSNRDLKKAVCDGKFREDLLYRLSVIPIEIPSLNDRVLDIEPLAAFFCRKYSKSKKVLSADLIKKLENFLWRGNIRELENFIHRAVVLSANNVIGCEDVALENCVPFPEPRNKLQKKTMKHIEQEIITKAVREFNGNKEMASKELGIPVRTLRHKLRRYEEKKHN